MTNSLKQYIKKRLKENVPVKEVIQQLKEKGYSLYEIKNSLKEVVAEMEHKPRKNLFLVVFIGIVLIVGIGIAIFYKTLPSKENEKTMIQEFMQKNLKEEYYPASLEIKKLSEIPNIVAINESNWSGKWKNEDITLSTMIQYDFINRMKTLMVSVSLPEITDLDNTTARSLHQEFFKTTGTEWNCRNDNNLTICESFSPENIDVAVSPVGNLSVTLIYSNKIYPY